MHFTEREAIIPGQVFRRDALEIPPGDVMHGDTMALNR